MKRLFTFLIILSSILMTATSAFGVTDKEMEQARTIAAQAYLRYANNGSGYLDDQKPTTMEELRKGLKAKEIENLKSFTAVAVPKDYASWDKARLTEYWSVTFFNSPGLIEAGKGAKSVVKKRIAAMTVAAPDASAAQEEKAQEAAKGEKPGEGTNLPVSLVDEEPSATDAAAAAELERRKAEADSIAALVAADTGQSEEPKKKGSGTWIYVTILVILIAVVVWLVVYASKTMSSSKREKTRDDRREEAPESDRRPEKGSAAAGGSSAAGLRSEFAQTVARKNEEIRRLSKELEDLGNGYRELEGANRILSGENARLTAETERLRAALSEAERRLQDAAHNAAANAGQRAAEERTIMATHVPRTRRTIYLGRVNARGLFVRADRTINPEGTVYKIETEDGYTGRYQVVNLPEVTGRVLQNPTQWLACGCECDDLLATEGVTRILTEVSGNAVFESGCWRVVTKAKISYA